VLPTLARRPEATSCHLGPSEFTAVAVQDLSGSQTDADEIAPRLVGTTSPTGSPTDIVEEWGVQSFPASDPPMNW
jgi:hypothetical protein